MNMENKTCSKCKGNKPLSEFRKDKTRSDGYSYTCKSCSSSRHKELYHKKYHIKAKIRTKKRHEEIRQLLNEYVKDKSCVNCGESDPVVFEFHHKNPKEKEFEIGSALNRKRENVLKELAKCIILCANCHRRVHWGKLNLPC